MCSRKRLKGDGRQSLYFKTDVEQWNQSLLEKDMIPILDPCNAGTFVWMWGVGTKHFQTQVESDCEFKNN
jgi:hypothetical protein